MNKAIALFDSGIGGLTVLQSILQVLPSEDYVYLADNAYFPYGTKSFDDVKARIVTIARYLSSLGVKAIVIACNTASLHAKFLKSIVNFPVIDVIAPTCRLVQSVTKNNKVCLLATDATVSSNLYQQILSNKGIQTTAVPCSTFVPIAEDCLFDEVSKRQIVFDKLSAIAERDFDTVVLGCTHFGLLEGPICSVLGNRSYVECGVPTAMQLHNVLSQNNLLSSANNGKIQLISTGSLDVFSNVSTLFNLPFTTIESVRI